MKNIIRFVLSALSLLIIIFLIKFLSWDFLQLKYYANSNYSTLATQRVTLRISVLILSIILLFAFNFLLWYKNFFGVPLTPEQYAERKRIIAERRKAKLQEKLNKLN